MLETNRNALARRWPRVLAALEAAPAPDRIEPRDEGAPTLLVDGIHLTSTRDRRAEARLQARLVPEDAAEACLYGVALGDLQRELLGRAALQRLRVVVLAPGVARASLDRFDHADWLDDPRVELVLGADERAPRHPFAAAPACLRLADEAAAPIRDRVALVLATPQTHRRVAAREEAIRARLEANRGRIARDGDLGELFGSSRGRRAWVCAAGPTLSAGLERLRARAPGEPVLAVDAALRPLLSAGVVPDVVVAVDDHDDGLLPYFAGDLAAASNATLAYAPVVLPEVLDRWPGRRCAFYTAHPRYAALRRELPRADLFLAGSVIHPCLDLAVRTGASEVLLVGADFCYPGGHSHAEGVEYRKPAGPELARADWWVLNGRGERVSTRPNLRGYLRDLEDQIARHPEVRFRTLSLEGARIEGAPFLDEVAGAGRATDEGAR